VKKILIVTLVAALCLSAVAAAGCGGDTETAKSYMRTADELSSRMSGLTSDNAFDALGLLADLGVQISETGTVEAETVTDAAIEQLDIIIENGEKAKAEYEKIGDLDGVEAYKEYASARIKAIDSTITVLEAVQELLAVLGDPDNKASVAATLGDWAKANAGTAVDAVRAYTSWRDADSIREENNLGPAVEPAPETEPGTSPQ
jgi:cytochrome c556